MAHSTTGNGSYSHQQNRECRCLFCQCLIPRSKQTSNLLVTKPSNTKLLVELFPLYRTDMAWLPAALCPSHYILLQSKTRSIPSGLIADTRSRIANSPIAIRTTAENCSSHRMCHFCKSTSDLRQPNTQLQLRHATPTPHPKRQPAFHVLEPLPKRVRSNKQTPSSTPPAQSRLDALSVVAMGSAARLSGRQKGRQADELRRRFASGDSLVTTPSGATIRKLQTKLNTTFSHDFTSKPCSYSQTDQGIVYCSDLEDFTFLYCWLRGKTVSAIKLIKLNGDDGQGSLKLMIQFLFDDDPIFSDDPLSERSDLKAAGSYTLLDTGPHRTYILALIHGCSESHASCAFLFQSVNLAVLNKICPSADIILPVDMKFANLLIGLQPHGAIHSYLWTMWSSSSKCSSPDTVRTMDSITADAKRYLAAQQHSTARVDPVHFNSTESLPVDLIVAMRSALLHIFPPPPLHLEMGITKSFFHYLERLSESIASAWLRSISVRRSQKHGGSDFPGNECRIIINSSAKLRRLPEFPSNISRRLPPTEIARLIAIQLLAKCFSDLSTVVTHVFSLRLHPDWASSIITLQQSYRAFTQQYNIFSPDNHSKRNPERISPKLQCLFHEVPAWIRSHKCSLNYASEQSFETIHKNFFDFAKRFSIPKTGVEIKPFKRVSKARLSQSSPRTPDSHGHRTASCTTPSDSISSTPIPISVPRMVVGPIETARRLRVTAVVTFNSENLPSDHAVQMRQLKSIQTIEAETAASRSTKPPQVH